MRLLANTDVPAGPGVRTLRVSPLGPLVLCALFGAFGVALVAALLAAASRAPVWVWALGAPVAGVVLLGVLLVELAVWSAFLAARKPTGWTLRVDRSGLWLPIRSWMNPELEPAGDTALFVPFAELRGARKVVRRSASGQEARVAVELELELAPGIDLEPVRAAVRAEGARRWPERRFLGIRSRSRAVHAPLRVAGADRLRVDWPGGRALAVLKDHGVRLLEPRREVEGVDPARIAAADERILAHLEEGEKLAAIRVAREAHGMGLAEAKAFVEDLVGASGGRAA